MCLVTSGSDTHLLVSYNNSLPHTVHPPVFLPSAHETNKGALSHPPADKEAYGYVTQ